MQKILAVIFVGVFLLFCSIGFGVTRQVKALSSQAKQPVAPTNQVNIVLVHIDNNNQTHPRLISVWAFFISRSEFPSIIMKRLYPENGSETASKLIQSFSMDEKKQPSDRFLDVLNELRLPSLKIAVSDDRLAIDWANGLVNQPIFDSLSFNTSTSNLDIAQNNDQQLFTSACSTIKNHASRISLVSTITHPDGNEIPIIRFSDDFLEWKGLVTSLHLSSCELLVGP
jgi:hypothetical protein